MFKTTNHKLKDILVITLVTNGLKRKQRFIYTYHFYSFSSPRNSIIINVGLHFVQGKSIKTNDDSYHLKMISAKK